MRNVKCLLHTVGTLHLSGVLQLFCYITFWCASFFSGDLRNDLYLTLHSGEFEKGEYTKTKWELLVKNSVYGQNLRSGETRKTWMVFRCQKPV